MAFGYDWCGQHSKPKEVCYGEGLHARDVQAANTDVGWCHKHSRPVNECKWVDCMTNANDPSYNPASDFTSPTDQASIEFKHIYDSLMREGFSETQALYLLAVQMCGNPGIAPGSALPEPPTPQ